MQRLLESVCKKVRYLESTLNSHRSDVLLRHRRRCHPTPPPADRSSRSPPAQHRLYPGVPISSSRNDYRELSPEPVRSRKRSRQGQGHGQVEEASRQSRPRLDDDEEPDDEEQFGESSQFARHNGMGNGGVYNGNNFYPTDNEPAYTPHLLPMFQHGVPPHTLPSHALPEMHPHSHVPYQAPPPPPPSESVHLEDASVLLSMAYPSGVPARDNPPPAIPDWQTGQQTINAMMEQAHDERTSRNSSLSDQANIDPVFSSLGNHNMLSHVDWMNQEKPHGQEGGWVSDIKLIYRIVLTK